MTVCADLTVQYISLIEIYPENVHPIRRLSMFEFTTFKVPKVACNFYFVLTPLFEWATLL